MEKSYLIDSNAVIDYLSGTLPENGTVLMNSVIDAIPKVSIITKLEVLGFNSSKNDSDILTSFFDDAIVLPLVDEVSEKTIEIRRSFSIKLPDAIIAATAIVFNQTLITRNVKDFNRVATLTCVNPHGL